MFEQQNQKQEQRENDEDFAQIVAGIVNKLVNQEVITAVEASELPADRIDEFVKRCYCDFDKYAGNSMSAEQQAKVRRIMGLAEQSEEKIDIEKRKQERAQLVELMREYLKGFQEKCSYVIGMLLTGSRMDIKKEPAQESDVDVALILKDGYEVHPSRGQGENLLFELRDYSDNHKVEDMPVELDALDTVTEFFSDLESDEWGQKLTWGWNDDAVQYIGGDLNDLDEAQVNDLIQETLKSNRFQNLKKRYLEKIKEEIKAILK